MSRDIWGERTLIGPFSFSRKDGLFPHRQPESKRRAAQRKILERRRLFIKPQERRPVEK
jgi:hypothetical protein